MDTVTLARQELEKQGTLEAEVSYGLEEDLHKHFNNCVKNPDHQKFAPVVQFNMGNLHPGCRDNDLVDYVRALSDLTVRVSSKYVSERRPETVPGSNKPYPSYKDRGRNMMRMGTGSVCRVDKYPNWRDISRTCKCQECLDSPTPKTQFAEIYIQTAAHVVYDELEAAHTTCHLFFDKGFSPRDCSGVLELSGWSFVWRRGEEDDWCLMGHVTHDLDLAELLDKMVARRVKLWEKVNNKYLGLESEKQKSSSPSEYLAEVREKVNNKYLGLESEKQKSSSPSEYLAEVREKVNNKYLGLESGEQKSSSPSEHLPEVREKVNKKYRELESWEQESSSPSEYLPEVREKVNNKYRGLESLKQESSSPSEYLPEVWEKVNNKYRGLESGEQKSSSPLEHLPEVLDNLTIIVSKPDGSNKQAQTYGEPTTIATNQDISQSVTMPDLVANSQNMGKVDEEKECLSKLLSVETEPSENLKKSESTSQINADKLPKSESFLSSLTDETETKSREGQPDLIHSIDTNSRSASTHLPILFKDKNIEKAVIPPSRKRKIQDKNIEKDVIPPSRKRKIQGSKMDTVTLAKQEREKQGPWEAEVSYGGEADLHKHLIGCVKNPGHQKFVPVDQFNVEHLPPGCRDNDIVDFVRALSDLTVRVSVKYVSERRPETVPGSDKPYPSYKDGSRNMLRMGTGWVCGVDKYPNEMDCSRICECQECLDSPTPKTKFAKIYIQSAAHVVYDELEAAHTMCHLFFDKGSSPRDCNGVRALSGWNFVMRGKVGDWCRMVHVTHDLDLTDLLDKMVARLDNLWQKVNKKYRRLKSGEQESTSPSEYLPEVWENLTLIVSHPHGCSKQISIGDSASWDVREGDLTWTKYTTPTCPGSSGAPVCVMWGIGLWVWVINLVHCGNCEDDKNLNFSNFNWR